MTNNTSYSFDPNNKQIEDFLKILFPFKTEAKEDIKEYDFIEEFLGLKDFTHYINKYQLSIEKINELLQNQKNPDK